MADTPNLIRATQNLPQVLVASQLASSEATVFTGPPNKSVAVATATLCNTSGATKTVYLSVVKAGSGSAGNSNRVAVIDLAASESCVVEELVGLLLAPGDFISGYASAATSVAIVISGAVSS